MNRFRYTVKELAQDTNFAYRAYVVSDNPVLFTTDLYEKAESFARACAQAKYFVHFGTFIDGIFEESFVNTSCGDENTAGIDYYIDAGNVAGDFIEPADFLGLNNPPRPSSLRSFFRGAEALSGIEDDDAASFALNGIPYPDYETEKR